MSLIFNNARTSITLTKEELIILFPIGIHCIFSLTASKTQSTKSTIFAKLCWGMWNYTSMRKVAYKAFNSNTVLISFIGSGDSLWKATNRRDFVFHFFTFRQLYIEQIYAFIYNVLVEHFDQMILTSKVDFSKCCNKSRWFSIFEK